MSGTLDLQTVNLVKTLVRLGGNAKEGVDFFDTLSTTRTLLKQASRLHRMHERECSDPTADTDRFRASVERAEARIVETGNKLGAMFNVTYTARVQGDPRSCSVILALEGKKDTGFTRDGEGYVGIVA